MFQLYLSPSNLDARLARLAIERHDPVAQNEESRVRTLEPEIGLPDLRPRFEFCRRSFGKESSFRDDIGVIAERECEVHILFDEENGESSVLERFQRREELVDDYRRKTERDFVDDQDLRIGETGIK